MNITPENITQLNEGEIFVFGSNEAGHHGAGAALFAHKELGARIGHGFGLTGRTFAIPTKDWYIQVLPLSDIKFYVDRFIHFALYSPRYHFLVTQIGCGLAGYTPEEIAPLFRKCLKMKNVSLPESFIKILEPTRLMSYDGADLDTSIPDNWKDR